ncbi:MAG: PHP domain-containing protein [Clostridiales bacterium]|nr:PHP domain-containing protein [Clostridiales bacterium]
MKIDTHTHTSGVSFCSEVSPEEYAEKYREADYGAVILTNHYSRMYMFRYGDTWDKQIRIYLDEFRKAKAAGERLGLPVLLGAEVAISTPQSPYIEFLLYGADEEFFLANPCLYDKSQAELYKICHDNGVLMFQSHPFRSEQGHFPQDPEYLDGTEINCHPYFLRHEDEVRAFADKNRLMLICGSDFHYPYQAGVAATIVPDSITDAKQFADFLRKNPRPEIWYK